MIAKSDIRKLADYVLLNAYSVDSTGFYNGKAGISLCLFEISMMLNDGFLEEHAFELLKESLLSKNTDIGFENGLSGIGYVLRYLIEHKFIEGDFNDLFRDNMKKIKDRVERLSEQERKRGDFLTVGNLLNDKIYLPLLVDPLYEELTTLLTDLSGLPPIKMMVIQKYTTLLKILSRYPDVYDISELSLIHASANSMRYALMNSSPSILTLSQRVDLLYWLRKDEPRHSSEIERLEHGLMDLSGKELEQTLVKLMNSSQFMAGYEHGISRFLLYITFLWHKRKGNDVSRFDQLFQ